MVDGISDESFFNTRNAQENKREKCNTYDQHYSHALRGQRGEEQFLDHVKAMKTPVLSYRLKGKGLSYFPRTHNLFQRTTHKITISFYCRRDSKTRSIVTTTLKGELACE